MAYSRPTEVTINRQLEGQITFSRTTAYESTWRELFLELMVSVR